MYGPGCPDLGANQRLPLQVDALSSAAMNPLRLIDSLSPMAHQVTEVTNVDPGKFCWLKVNCANPARFKPVHAMAASSHTFSVFRSMSRMRAGARELKVM